MFQALAFGVILAGVVVAPTPAPQDPKYAAAQAATDKCQTDIKTSIQPDGSIPPKNLVFIHDDCAAAAKLVEDLAPNDTIKVSVGLYYDAALLRIYAAAADKDLGEADPSIADAKKTDALAQLKIAETDLMAAAKANQTAKIPNADDDIGQAMNMIEELTAVLESSN